MNKIFITLACLFCGAFALQAQGRHEVNAFIGGYKSEYINSYGGNEFFGNMDIYHCEDLYDLYEPHYSLETGPVLTISYHYIFNKWLRLGAQTNLGGLSGKCWYELGNRPAESFNEVMLSVLPEAKFCIPGARHFRLYGKVAAGIQMNMGTLSSRTAPVSFAWDVVPLGAEWGGQRVYGNAEICFGSVIRGGRIGIGFRF
jgi:hypothetical protein